MQNYESNEPQNFPPPPVKKDFFPTDALPPSPDNPPWNSWAAVGVWVASIAFIVVLQGIFLSAYLAQQNIDFADRNAVAEFAKTDPTAILLQIGSVVPAHILTLLLGWLVVTGFRKYPFRETLGWRWNGFNVWTALIILGGFFAAAGIVNYYIPGQETELIRILKSSRSAVYIVAFMATFTAPLVEEVVYRGVLYSAFQRAVGVPAAVALVTFLFALVHVPQYYESVSTIIMLTVLSLILTLIRARTKNLLPCIALHTLFNAVQSLLLIAQPYLEKAVEQKPPPAAFFIHLFK